VARQYCGQLGKQDNCQVAVTLSLANHHASLPVAYQLYLPKEWADDKERCRKAGVPEDIDFRTKPEIALEQVRWALEAGLPRGAVLMDAGYGASTDLRESIAVLDLPYVAGIGPQTSVWAPGEDPLPPKRWSGKGRQPKLLRRDAKHKPISVRELALNSPASAWRNVTWREGAAAPLSSRFARVRVRVAHRDYRLTEIRSEEWLLIEWLAQFRRSRAPVPSDPEQSHSPIHRERCVRAPLGADEFGLLVSSYPKEEQPVPVVNRRGPCAPRSDRHEPNGAARTGGPC
jgi:SRSO17 transposase